MKLNPTAILLLVFLINVLLRLIFVFYGYIGSEEGFLIYGQKLAYQGLIPFIDYNAWNSLLNNYLVGWYQFFLHPTIITQRLFGLIMASLVFFLVVYISKHFHKTHGPLISAALLTFGSFTYLYFSTIPYSEQTMTLVLVASWALLMKSITSPKNKFLPYFSLCLAVLAAPIRPQAIPAIICIWLYLIFVSRQKIKKIISLTATGIIFGFLLYLPFILRGWDNFLYSILWPLQSNKILVYQVNDKILDFSGLLRFFLEMFNSYGIFISIIGAFLAYKLIDLKSTLYQIKNELFQSYVFFSLLSAISMASMGLLHRPPYATYIYPAIPLFTYSAVFILIENLHQFRRKNQPAVKFIYFFLGLLLFNNLVIFRHVDFMKTSLKTISKTTYSQLREISLYIESKTTNGSEIMAFYTPSVAQINRTLPININEGEVSVSILPQKESEKFHLANQQMLKNYISSQTAEGIVITSKSSKSFGITADLQKEVMDEIEKYYFLEKTFDNFSQIGNPRVPYLYFYLRKKV